MNKNQTLSWDDVEAMRAQNEIKFANLMQTIQENGKQMKENYERLAESKLETDLQLKQLGKDLRESDYRCKERLDELGKYLGETDHKTKERLDKLGMYLGGIANSNGDMAEEYFFNTFRRDKTFANEKYDKIRQNVSYPEDDNDPEIECDIILINGKSTALIEVKYNAKPENIKIEELIARAKYLKENSVKHKNHNIYLGVAAMSFKKGFAKKLRNAGIATIHQIGKKMVIYDKEVKVF